MLSVSDSSKINSKAFSKARQLHTFAHMAAVVALVIITHSKLSRSQKEDKLGANMV